MPNYPNQEIKWNDGEGVTSADLNAMQRAAKCRELDMLQGSRARVNEWDATFTSGRLYSFGGGAVLQCADDMIARGTALAAADLGSDVDYGDGLFKARGSDFEWKGNTLASLNADVDIDLAALPADVSIRASVSIGPMTGKAEWALRSYQDKPDATRWGGQNVYDVRSTSGGTALDGTKYSDW